MYSNDTQTPPAPQSTEKKLEIKEFSDKISKPLQETISMDTINAIPQLPKKKPTVSVFSASFNIANSTIGAGILGLPYVLRECGLLLGVFAITVCGIIGICTFFLLHFATEYVRKKTKIKNYEQIGKYCFGVPGQVLVNIAMIVMSVGCLISYTVILGSLLIPLCELIFGKTSWIMTKVNTRLVLTLFIIIPVLCICLAKSIKKMRFLSYFSLSTQVIFAAFIIIAYSIGLTTNERQGDVELFKFEPGVLRAVGVVVFAYAGHYNLVSITSDFDDESRLKKVPLAVVGGIGLCFFFFTIVSIFGYLNFVDNTKDSIVDSFANNWSTSFFRFLLLFTISMTYPLLMFAARGSIIFLLKEIYKFFKRIIKNGKSIPKKDSGNKKDLEGKNGEDKDVTSAPVIQNGKMTIELPNIKTIPQSEVKIDGPGSPPSLPDVKRPSSPQLEKEIILGFQTPVSQSPLMSPITSPMISREPSVEFDARPLIPPPPSSKKEEEVPLPKKKPFLRRLFSLKNIAYVTLTFIIGAGCFFYGVFNPTVGFLFSITGSTAATGLSYIFPTIFYIKTCDHKWCSWQVILSLVLLIYGACFGTIATGYTIFNASTK